MSQERRLDLTQSYFKAARNWCTTTATGPNHQPPSTEAIEMATKTISSSVVNDNPKSLISQHNSEQSVPPIASSLAVFDQGEALAYIVQDGEFFFTAEEIGRHLGYSEPAKAINTLFRRNRNELKLYSRHISLMCRDGIERNSHAFSEEGLYILSMLARTNEAKKFRARVALLLRRIRKEYMERQLAEAEGRGFALGTEQARNERPAQLQAAEQAGVLKGMKMRRDTLGIARKILVYRAKGLSFMEIARVLRMPSSTASDLYRRARLMAKEVHDGFQV